MWEGAVLLIAGVTVGFVGGCVGCAEVFFWAGARAARWAYRAGRLDAAREEEAPEYIEELLPPGPGVPEDRAEEVMKRVRGKGEIGPMGPISPMPAASAAGEERRGES